MIDVQKWAKLKARTQQLELAAHRQFADELHQKRAQLAWRESQQALDNLRVELDRELFAADCEAGDVDALCWSPANVVRDLAAIATEPSNIGLMNLDPKHISRLIDARIADARKAHERYAEKRAEADWPRPRFFPAAQFGESLFDCWSRYALTSDAPSDMTDRLAALRNDIYRIELSRAERAQKAEAAAEKARDRAKEYARASREAIENNIARARMREQENQKRLSDELGLIAKYRAQIENPRLIDSPEYASKTASNGIAHDERVIP